MSVRQSRALRNAALLSATALARYERHVRQLAASWLDMDLYRTVSREIDEIQESCAVLPKVALARAALLVSHADLIHALWRSTHQRADRGEVQAQLREHLDCIDALAQRCLHLAEAEAGSLA